MAYKNDVLPQKGDSVMGKINGLPVRGRVLEVTDSGNGLVFQRRGAAVTHKPSGQKLQGPLLRHEVPAGDFELVYRKEA